MPVSKTRVDLFADEISDAMHAGFPTVRSHLPDRALTDTGSKPHSI